MIGFVEINMVDIHVIVLIIGMATCVNTQTLTEQRFLGVYITYLSHICRHLFQQNIDLIRIK